jgi:hypothetical protein
MPGYVAMKLQVGKSRCVVGLGYLTILLTSSAEPGSTEQADPSVLEDAECEMSNKYSGAALSSIRLEIMNERMTH